MTIADLTPHLMAALSLPFDAAQDAAPEWVHLLPAGQAGVIGTDDARGPYHVEDLEKIIQASLGQGDKLAIDENHSTDLAAPRGDPAPARGWIVEMHARPDGIWGRVEWTEQGAALVLSKAYRGISPVILASEDKRIASILRASLVNQPNLRGMVSLHQSQDTPMNLRDAIAEMLGMASTATDDELMTALKAKMKPAAKQAEMQHTLGDIAVQLGLAQDVKPDAVVAAVKTLHAAQGAETGKDGLIVELQSSVKSLSEQVTALTTGQNAAASEAFYNSALAERRAGVGPASKAHLISLHQADPKAAIAFVQSMPKLGESGLTLEQPAPKEGEVHLNASQRAVAAQMGMTEADYAAEMKTFEEEAG